MDLGLVLPRSETISPVTYARRAEDLGFTSVWFGELSEYNALAVLGAVAAETEDVRLGSSVVNVFSRTPALLAMSAATLDDLSDGRAALGVGVSTEKTVEKLHGLAFDRPVRRTHETIEAVTELLGAGSDPVSYAGELVTVDGYPRLDTDVPVLNAALGDANLRVTGRLADGWMPNLFPRSRLEAGHATLAGAAREAGRDPAEISVYPWYSVMVDEDVDRARHLLREKFAYYVGYGEGYRDVVGRAYPEQSDRIHAAWQRGNREQATDHVTDEMVDDLGIAATPDTVADEVRSLCDEPVVDEPILTLPLRLSDEQRDSALSHLTPRDW